MWQIYLFELRYPYSNHDIATVFKQVRLLSTSQGLDVNYLQVSLVAQEGYDTVYKSFQ